MHLLKSDEPTNCAESIKKGRMELDQAFSKIKEPWELPFEPYDMICLDCGMVGEEKLLPPMCHQEDEEIPGCTPCGSFGPGTGQCGP